MNVESGIQITDLWSIALRRAKVVAATTLGVTLVAFWVAMALPNQFRSYATVLVTPQTVSQELVASGVPKSDLNNRLFLMTAEILSRGRMTTIIDDLELYEEESKYLLREEVIDFMRKDIKVTPVLTQLRLARGKSSTGDDTINQFKISFTHRDPLVAMQVVTRLSNDFITQHIESRIKLSEKSVEFIEGELTRLAKRIQLLEAQESALKAENTGRLPQDVNTNQRRLERLMTNLALAQQTLAEATSDEAFYQSQIAGAASAGGNLTPTGRLQMLSLVVAELKAKGFTDKHPDIVKVRMEQKELEEAIARDETALKTNDNLALSVSQRGIEAERRRAALRKGAAQEEIARLNDSIDAIQTLLSEAPAVAEALLGLEREYRHLFDSYQDFSDRRLEASVQAQLERRQLGEKFRVLEAAFVAPGPTFPNRTMIVIIGIFFGFSIGFAVGIVLETIDPSVHSARQLQAVVGIPVLSAIPKILLEADLAALRRSRIRTAALTLALICFVGVGGGANYVWVNGVPTVVANFFADEDEKSNEGQPGVVPSASIETEVDPSPVAEE